MRGGEDGAERRRKPNFQRHLSGFSGVGVGLADVLVVLWQGAELGVGLGRGGVRKLLRPCACSHVQLVRLGNLQLRRCSPAEAAQKLHASNPLQCLVFLDL